MEVLEKSSQFGRKTIFDLGDDCLYLVVSYLDIIDQIQLAMLDVRFESCLRRFLKKTDFNVLDIMVKFNEHQIKTIFSNYGSMIKRLNLETRSHNTKNYLQLATQYCKDLDELRCFCSKGADKAICLTLVASSPSLKSLKIYEWGLYDFEDTNDTISPEIAKLSYLTRLSLSGGHITGENLHNLKNLTYLNVRGCWDLSSKHFIEICKSCKLRTLNIGSCNKLDNEALENLVETQTELIDLTMGGIYENTSDITIVARLKNLKAFTVDCCEVTDVIKLIRALAEHKSDSLQYLSAGDLVKCGQYSYEGYFPLDEDVSQSILSCLVKFKHLKELHLPKNTFLNSQTLQAISRACQEIEVLNMFSSYTIDLDAIFSAVKELKQLGTMNGCFYGDFRFYKRLYEVVKERNTVFLTVYGGCDKSMKQFVTSMEYNKMQNYIDVKACQINDSIWKYHRKHTTKKLSIINRPPIQSFSNDFTEVSILDLPDEILQEFFASLDPIDKLKLVLIHSRFYDFMTVNFESEKIDLDQFMKYFTFDETLRILSICSKYVKKMHFRYKDGEKPSEYLEILESFKKDFIELDIDSCPENYTEDNIWLLFE